MVLAGTERPAQLAEIVAQAADALHDRRPHGHVRADGNDVSAVAVRTEREPRVAVVGNREHAVDGSDDSHDRRFGLPARQNPARHEVRAASRRTPSRARCSQSGSGQTSSSVMATNCRARPGGARSRRATCPVSRRSDRQCAATPSRRAAAHDHVCVSSVEPLSAIEDLEPIARPVLRDKRVERLARAALAVPRRDHDGDGGQGAAGVADRAHRIAPVLLCRPGQLVLLRLLGFGTIVESFARPRRAGACRGHDALLLKYCDGLSTIWSNCTPSSRI